MGDDTFWEAHRLEQSWMLAYGAAKTLDALTQHRFEVAVFLLKTVNASAAPVVALIN